MKAKDYDNHVPLWQTIICAAVAYGCFYIINSIEKADGSMEVGIGIVGLCGICCAMYALVGIVNLVQRIFKL